MNETQKYWATKWAETLKEKSLRSEPSEADISTKCGGGCCRLFVLPVAPEDLAERLTRTPDGDVMADMLEHVVSTTDNLVEMIVPDPSEGLKHYYRCNKLGADGLCTIYETRPRTCREYPYEGTKCNFGSCTGSCAATKDTPLTELRP